MHIPKSVKLTYIDQLVIAIRTNDAIGVNSTLASVRAKFGHIEATACYKCAVIAVNAKPYEFTDFTPQVKSKTADKSYVRQDKHTGHNED